MRVELVGDGRGPPPAVPLAFVHVPFDRRPRAQRAASALRLLGAHGSCRRSRAAAAPARGSRRRASAASVRDSVSRGVGQRTDEAKVVARLEAVRRRREVEQIGDRVQRDDTVRRDPGCCAATSSAVNPPALPPISTTRSGSPQPSFTAWRIPAATSATSRSPQRPASACVYARAVAGRAAVVRLQHRAAALHEPLHPRRSSRRAPGRSARRARCTTSGGRGRRDRPATTTRARSRCRDFHVTARGSTRRRRFEPADRAARDRRADPNRSPRARRPAAASPRRSARTRCRARPSRGRGASPSTARAPSACPAHRSRAGRSRPRCGTTRARVPSGDHAYERWPGPHAGSACSCVFAQHRLRVPAVRIRRPHDRPAVGVADEREPRCRRARSGADRRRSRRHRRRPSRRPSSSRTMIRDASHGMSGRSHSCQASREPSGDHAGSHA